MNTGITFLLFIAFISICKADTLVWDHSDGWNKGIILTLDTSTNKLKVHDRDKDHKYEATCRNSKIIVDYIQNLLLNIPKNRALQVNLWVNSGSGKFPSV